MRYYIFILVILALTFNACNKKNQDATSGDTPVSDEFTPKGGDANLEDINDLDLPVSYDDMSYFSEASELAIEGDVDVLAFGSCNKHDLPQPLWGPILATKPDAWIWLGDAVYGDSPERDVLKAKFDAQNENIGYQKLKKMSHVLGTWDDHDYGKNDGTKLFEGKEVAKDVFLEFLEVPDNHPTRKRDGIYQAYTMGDGEKKVKIILLDTRTFRDKVSRDDQKVYIPDPEADILGEAQWKWLAGELKNNDAAITIIANGTQVISRFHRFEKWGNYPKSRKRLFKMIKTFCPSGAILISGDRHHAEFSRVNIPETKHPLYEFTSSGMTHTRKFPRPEVNKFRVGKKVDKLNFGVIRINWNANPVKVTMEIKGEGNKVLESCEFDVVK